MADPGYPGQRAGADYGDDRFPQAFGDPRHPSPAPAETGQQAQFRFDAGGTPRADGAYDDPGYADPGHADGGYTDSGYSDAGYADGGYQEAGYPQNDWAEPGPARSAGGRPRSNRQARSIQRARAREARWQNNRLAVPYPTDGPKVTFGVLWFLALLGAAVLGAYVDRSSVSAVAVAAVASPIAALAGLQAGNAWFPSQGATRSWTAAAAYLTGLAGLAGPWGVPIGLIIGFITVLFYVLLYRGHRRTSAELLDVLSRAAIPAGLAVASLAALGSVGIGVQISLILLVSAYEAGDFIVGSGSSNAIEGPLAGLVALGVMAFILFLIQPAPFDSRSVLLFAVMAGICCPLGQILASGLLPRGNAWAPALRRLDSYLLAAPIWLILVLQLPAAA